MDAKKWEDTPEGLEALAAQNDRYAGKCEETFGKTGRDSALRQAEQHRAAAASKRARAAAGRDTQTNIWVPADLMPALDAEAEREGRTRQKQLEMILRQHYSVPR